MRQAQHRRVASMPKAARRARASCRRAPAASAAFPAGLPRRSKRAGRARLRARTSSARPRRRPRLAAARRQRGCHRAENPGDVQQRAQQSYLGFGAARSPPGRRRGGHVHADAHADQEACDEELWHRLHERRGDGEHHEEDQIGDEDRAPSQAVRQSPKTSMPTMAPRNVEAPSRPTCVGDRSEMRAQQDQRTRPSRSGRSRR